MKQKNILQQQSKELNADQQIPTELKDEVKSIQKKDSIFNSPFFGRNLPAHLSGNVTTIEIDTNHLKIVTTSFKRNKTKILNYSETELPTDNNRRFIVLLDALQVNFIKHSPPRGRVVLSLAGPDILTRKFEIPKVEKKQLREVVLWQLKNDISNFTESHIWDYEEIGEYIEDGKSILSVLTAVVPEQFSKKYLNLLASLKIYPAQIVIKSMALVQAVKYAVEAADFKPDKVTMIAEINRSSTLLCFIRNGHLEFSRRLSLGSDLIDASLNKPLHFKDKHIKTEKYKMEELKRKFGILPEFIQGTNKTHYPFNQIYHAIYPILQQFLGEFTRTLTFYNNNFADSEIGNLMLTGNGCHLKNLDLYFENKLGYPTHSFFPAEDEKGDPLYEYTAAFGAALTSPEKFNFLPTAVRKTYKINSAQKILNISSVIIVLALSASTYFLYQNAQNFENILSQLDQNYTNLAPSQVRYLKAEKELANQTAIQSIYQENSAASPVVRNLLQLVSSTIPKDIFLFRLAYYEKGNSKVYDVNPEDEGTLFLDAAIQSNLLSAEIILFEYMKDLENCGAFKSVEVYEKIKDMSHNTFEFSLKCRLK